MQCAVSLQQVVMMPGVENKKGKVELEKEKNGFNFFFFQRPSKIENKNRSLVTTSHQKGVPLPTL